MAKGIMISIGKWGGLYFVRGWSWRLCLGWVAISIFPVDGDDILALAEKGALSVISSKNKT